MLDGTKKLEYALSLITFSILEMLRTISILALSPGNKRGALGCRNKLGSDLTGIPDLNKNVNYFLRLIYLYS